MSFLRGLLLHFGPLQCDALLQAVQLERPWQRNRGGGSAPPGFRIPAEIWSRARGHTGTGHTGTGTYTVNGELITDTVLIHTVTVTGPQYSTDADAGAGAGAGAGDK